MAYDLAKVTANGNNLIAQILANKSSLSIDKIEISDTQLPSTTDISTMTSVPKVVQTVSANGFSKNSNTLIISTVVDNSSIRADYKAWVFGIWGSDSQNGRSQLIAVITSTNSPDTIPAFSGRTPVSYTYRFNIGFSNASQIQFNMIDDSFATNDTVVHTTGDETIDGQKKFKTDPTDGAGNAYAKTVDVNQQLDKKVVDNKDGTEQLNGVQVQPFNKLSDTIGGRNLLPGTSGTLQTVTNASGYNTNLPVITPVVTTIDSDTTYTARVWLSPAPTSHVMNVQIVWKDSSGTAHYEAGSFISAGTSGYSTWTGTVTAGSTIQYVTIVFYPSQSTSSSVSYKDMKLEQGSIATDWTPAPEDKVNVSDMRKPASDIAGIEEVNAKQDKIGYTPADDSKVAHLSGANNFDTVPTVNNNPLLLASSLPSDLARTGSNQEYTGKNTFDIAPIDKTTGNPYITKDGVPSDVARTGQAQTFTAAQTFSIAPTITDASKDKGDNQAATMADLKSVKKSAWHTVTLPDSQGLKSITMVYKNHEDDKYIEANIYAQSIYGGPYGCIMLDLSGIVNRITNIDLTFTSVSGSAFNNGDATGMSYAAAVRAKISLASNYEIYGTAANVSIMSNIGGSFAKIYYDSLVNN
ncbi:hypothetical protein [Lentilactobacillus parabuchneri]|uniref:hypothetical protein n=1 Tax=Lentilactobacillus parabuchneri TaxID=152331 RepID=UPI00345F0E5F